MACLVFVWECIYSYRDKNEEKEKVFASQYFMDSLLVMMFPRVCWHIPQVIVTRVCKIFIRNQGA
jgi:hypothetical protein